MEKIIKIKRQGDIKGTVGWLSSLDLSIIIKYDEGDNAIIALLVDNTASKTITVLVEHGDVTGKALHQRYISADVTDACCNAIYQLAEVAKEEIENLAAEDVKIKFSVKKEGEV